MPPRSLGDAPRGRGTRATHRTRRAPGPWCPGTTTIRPTSTTPPSGCTPNAACVLRRQQPRAEARTRPAATARAPSHPTTWTARSSYSSTSRPSGISSTVRQPAVATASARSRNGGDRVETIGRRGEVQRRSLEHGPDEHVDVDRAHDSGTLVTHRIGRRSGVPWTSVMCSRAGDREGVRHATRSHPRGLDPR